MRVLSILVAVANGDEGPFAPQSLEYAMARDAEQIPGDSPSRRIELMAVAHQGDEDVVRHVLGKFSRTAHSQRESIDASLPSIIKSLKSVAVSGQHQPQKFLVA